MKQYIYEKTNGLWYERRGDYYFQCLTAEETPPVGVWVQRMNSIRHRAEERVNHNLIYV